MMKRTIPTLILVLTLWSSNADADIIVLADSVSDFSDVQGQGNWYYGFYDKTNDPNHQYAVTDFQLMTQFLSSHSLSAFGTGSAWYVEDGTYFTSLWASGGHPNGLATSGGRSTVEHFAIRRWVSDFAGPVTISGFLSKLDTAGENGIAGRIVVDGVFEYGQFIAGTDGVGVTYSVNSDVAVGSTVDFFIDAWMANDLSDSTTFTATIVGDPGATVPEPSTLAMFLGLGGMGLIAAYRRRKRAA